MARNIQSKLQMETLIHFLSFKRVIHEDLLSKKMTNFYEKVSFTRRETNFYIFLRRRLRHHLYNTFQKKIYCSKNVSCTNCYRSPDMKQYERAQTRDEQTLGPPV